MWTAKETIAKQTSWPRKTDSCENTLWADVPQLIKARTARIGGRIMQRDYRGHVKWGIPEKTAGETRAQRTAGAKLSEDHWDELRGENQSWNFPDKIN